MGEMKSNTQRENSQTEREREQKSEKKTCQCPTETGKKLDKRNGPLVTAYWLDASKQAKNNLYIRTVHQPSKTTYFMSLYIINQTNISHTKFKFCIKRV